MKLKESAFLSKNWDICNRDVYSYPWGAWGRCGTGLEEQSYGTLCICEIVSTPLSIFSTDRWRRVSSNVLWLVAVCSCTIHSILYQLITSQDVGYIFKQILDHLIWPQIWQILCNGTKSAVDRIAAEPLIHFTCALRSAHYMDEIESIQYRSYYLILFIKSNHIQFSGQTSLVPIN